MQIAIETCLSGRELTEPRLSPDGRLVTFVAREAGPAAIIAIPATGGPERQLTVGPAPAPGRKLGGGCHAWMPDGRAVVYAATDGQLWSQPLDATAPRLVLAATPDAPIQAPSISRDGSVVVVMVDQAQIWLAWLNQDRDPVRIDAGEEDFCFDPFVEVDPEGIIEVRWQAWSVPDMAWDSAVTRTASLQRGVVVAGETVSGRGAIQQPRSMPDGRSISVRDDSGWLNVWIDGAAAVEEPFEHAGPTWGPGQRSYAVSPDGRSLAWCRNEGGFGRLCMIQLDTPGAPVHEMGRGVHGQLHWRGDRLVALRSGARTPTEVVVYDTATRPWTRRCLVVGPVLGWDAIELPEPELVRTDSGDGTVIHSRRYVAGNGKVLCWIHGGPTDQWQVEFMVRVAYWWSRGWDVVVPDPRGSTGHGRDYQQALRGQWGHFDVDDTAAVLAHAHEAGWATAADTVVVGGSSGGLTVLGVLARHRELVSAGVAVYPVTDLADLSARSHRFEAHYTLTLVGGPEQADRYHDRSPVNWAEQISGPLLIMHGDADPVVPIDHSRVLVERIRAAGGSVEFHEFAGEGHGFRDRRNKLAEYQLMEEFIDRIGSQAG